MTSSQILAPHLAKVLFKGIGKPQPLKYIASDTWSRRIDLEHRLVYKVKGDRVYFLQARYHYQKSN
ncbi:MAG: Txe/YoeB family addiction module toxin [Xenococcaceae cyanobacterium MO_188.B19]|nr:Txe/YoeB family addiction module toxin [Xenococcaceae cyanobacterium MO_188.B19]